MKSQLLERKDAISGDLFWPSWTSGTHMVHRHTCRKNTHAHTIKKKTFLRSTMIQSVLLRVGVFCCSHKGNGIRCIKVVFLI